MLAPAQSVVNEFLQNFLNAYRSVWIAALSMRNTQFFPIKPTPVWMQILQSNLEQAQQLSSDFLVAKGPLIISQVPQYFTNYANSISILCSNINNTHTKDEVIRQLQWLKNHIINIPTNIKALYDSLDNFSTQLKSYKQNIEQALQSATQEVEKDRADVINLSDQIGKLMQDISRETNKASNGMTSLMSSDASMSVALLSWSYAAATSVNPALPIVSVVVAIGGITYGAITQAINETKIVEQLNTIKILSHDLLVDNQSITILQTLSCLLRYIDDTLIAIRDAMDVSPVWQEESDKLSALIITLQMYKGQDFKNLADIASLPNAVSNWQTLAQWAINVQKSASGMISSGVIDLDKKLSIMYAA